MLLTKVVMPEDKYSIKCPYLMVPEGITVHNTANDASAMAEISYMIRNDKEVSFHYAIDDYRVVQGIEDNRNAWGSGDGHGFGNMKTLQVEICYSKSGGEKFTKAEQNAAEFIARKMIEYNWDFSKITDERKSIGTHKDRSNKGCPHRTIENGLDRFWNMVKERYNEIKGIGNSNIVVDDNVNNTGRNIGDLVTINGIYTSSTSSKMLNPLIKEGMITRIISGARNPYLLNNGNLGWVNDDCIVESQNSDVKVETTKEPNISVGSTVVLSGNATNYATGQNIPSQYKNRKYTIMQVKSDRVLLRELYSWVYIKDLIGI